MGKVAINGGRITLGEIPSQIINMEIKTMGRIHMRIKVINGDSKIISKAINIVVIILGANSLLSQITMFQLSLIVGGVSKEGVDGDNRSIVGIKQILIRWDKIKDISNRLINITSLLFKVKTHGINHLHKGKIHGTNLQVINGEQILKASNPRVGISRQLFLLLSHLFLQASQPSQPILIKASTPILSTNLLLTTTMESTIITLIYKAETLATEQLLLQMFQDQILQT